MSQKRFTGAKIVIFGSGGVGKTAFAVRYLTKRYIGDYDRDKGELYVGRSGIELLGSSMGQELYEVLNGRIDLIGELYELGTLCGVTVQSDQAIRRTQFSSEMMYTHKPNSSRDDVILEILDTGSKSSPDILEKHIKWAEGFVFIYSITDRPSLNYITTVKDVLDRVKGQGHETPLVLVGNKSDLISARVITEDEGQETANQFDCPFFEISVADGTQGVMEVMEELICLLKRDFVKSASNANASSSDKPKSKLFSMKKAFKKRINRSHSDTF